MKSDVLEVKLDWIRRLKNGHRKAKIRWDLGPCLAAVQTIFYKSDEYKNKIKRFNILATCTGNRKSLMVEMTHLLLLWIEEWTGQNQIPNPFVLKLVAVLKEMAIIRSYSTLPIKAGFIVSKSTWIMLSYSVKTISADMMWAIAKFAPRFAFGSKSAFGCT